MVTTYTFWISMSFLMNQLIVFGIMIGVVGIYVVVHFLKNKSKKQVTYDEYFKKKNK